MFFHGEKKKQQSKIPIVWELLSERKQTKAGDGEISTKLQCPGV